MQSQTNCHRHLWLLTGTGEGPSLAESFISKGWKVSVSVVSYEASLAYSKINLEALWIGPLNGVDGICFVLENSIKAKKKFDCVIDATHPFATEITRNLIKACSKCSVDLIRYDRPCSYPQKANLLNGIEDLAKIDLRDKKVLLAIGSNYLPQAVVMLKKVGAIPFARVLPRSGSVSNSLIAGLPESHLAVLKPTDSNQEPQLEIALCRRWAISAVICRQSGGRTQKIWELVSKKEKIDLWLISRPKYSQDIKTISTSKALLNYVDFLCKDL